MTRFRPEQLFERWRPGLPGPYRRDTSELDAVRSGKKGMSMYSVSRGYVAESSNFVELANLAFERGLALVLVPEEPRPNERPEHQAVTAYVVRREQVWRVSAMRALRDTAFEGGPWTDAAERQQSTLLGYTPAQFAAWKRFWRWKRIAWGCLTTYALLATEQRDRVVALAQRCLGTPEELVGLRVFCERRVVLRKDAFARVPRGLTLARFGLDHGVARELLDIREERRGSLLHATIAADDAARVAGGLTTRVELLGRGGWLGTRA